MLFRSLSLNILVVRSLKEIEYAVAFSLSFCVLSHSFGIVVTRNLAVRSGWSEGCGVNPTQIHRRSIRRNPYSMIAIIAYEVLIGWLDLVNRGAS